MKKLFLVSACLILIHPFFAQATLGEKQNSIDTDQLSFKAKNKSVVQKSLYSVSQIDSTGVTVKEYVASDGTVFAVTWTGKRRPDLATLFGSYYSEYQEANSAQAQSVNKSMGRKPVDLKTARLLVQKGGGHMRYIHGKAIIQSLVPAGVSSEEIQ